MSEIKVGTKLIAVDDLKGMLKVGKEYEVIEVGEDVFCVKSECYDTHAFYFEDANGTFFKIKEEQFKAPKHYDNSNGSLYKVATERGWNSYLFDIVKRLERANKKGEFETDLQKSKLVIDLWLKEK